MEYMKKYAVAILSILFVCLVSTIFAYQNTDQSVRIDVEQAKENSSSIIAKPETHSLVETFDIATPAATVANASNGLDLKKILETINEESSMEDRVAARAMLFEYSRSGNPPDLRDLLKSAFKQKLISTNEYHGELAHMLSIFTDNAVEIFDEVINSGNLYSIEVLFFVLASKPSWIASLNERERMAMLASLESQKPGFVGDMSTLGLSEVSRYENWIESMKNLSGSGDFLSHLSDLVNHHAADPREFHAIVSSGYYEKLKSSGKTAAARRIEEIMAGYQQSYPNTDVSNIVLQRMNRPY